MVWLLFGFSSLNVAVVWTANFRPHQNLSSDLDLWLFQLKLQLHLHGDILTSAFSSSYCVVIPLCFPTSSSQWGVLDMPPFSRFLVEITYAIAFV